MTIAKDAVDRLTAKLQAYKGTGRAVDMNEELRLLTLQVIGEAILSLPPDECDRVRTAFHPCGLVCGSSQKLAAQCFFKWCPKRG